MISTNPIIGTGLHAIGGISASSCYLPFHKTKKWSWGTFWLVQAVFAWIIMPMVIGILTVPNFFGILLDAPPLAFWGAFILGAIYGFGGMSFGLAIRHIGYSLTYTIAIGISAVLGTVIPLAIFGGIISHFTGPGGGIVLTGMIISIIGVILCGWAGFKKEKDIGAYKNRNRNFKFNIRSGIAVGMSVLLGIVIFLMKRGILFEYYNKPTEMIIYILIIILIVFAVLFGMVEFKKGKHVDTMSNGLQFNMLTGLVLAIIAGILSGIFNVSLEFGQPIADMAAAQGAGHFEGNAKLIVSTSGCCIVNVVWFLVAGIKQKTLKEFTSKLDLSSNILLKNFLWSAFAGSLWCFQFFFYGLGHVYMGKFRFTSWVLHMSMLIFFSYIVGVIMKEWKSVKRNTYVLLIIALLTLIISFIITAYGSKLGNDLINAASNQ